MEGKKERKSPSFWVTLPLTISMKEGVGLVLKIRRRRRERTMIV